MVTGSLKSDTKYTDELEIEAVNKIDSLYSFNTTIKSFKDNSLQTKSMDLNTNYTTIGKKFIKRSTTTIKNLTLLYFIVSKFFVTIQRGYIFFGTDLALERSSVVIQTKLKYSLRLQVKRKHTYI